MLMVFLVILGVFRVIFKPLMSFVQVYVKATPSTSDDAALASFEASKAYTTLVWCVDFLLSVKLPKGVPGNPPEDPAVAVAAVAAPKA